MKQTLFQNIFMHIHYYSIIKKIYGKNSGVHYIVNYTKLNL